MGGYYSFRRANINNRNSITKFLLFTGFPFELLGSSGNVEPENGYGDIDVAVLPTTKQELVNLIESSGLFQIEKSKKEVIYCTLQGAQIDFMIVNSMEQLACNKLFHTNKSSSETAFKGLHRMTVFALYVRSISQKIEWLLPMHSPINRIGRWRYAFDANIGLHLKRDDRNDKKKIIISQNPDEILNIISNGQPMNSLEDIVEVAYHQFSELQFGIFMESVYNSFRKEEKKSQMVASL